jgi:hypothetical protein
MEYRTLTDTEKLAILKDYLRSAETEHYRISMSSPLDPSRDQRVAQAAEELTRLQKEYDALVKEAK